jgi:hypothetical protein
MNRGTGAVKTTFTHFPERHTMTKLLSSLILVAFAFSAQAASHMGGAPMAASAPMKKPAMAASAPMKKASAPMKKEEMKK